MINLYIDTNAYLTFYHLTSDDLEELKKLEVLTQKTGEINLHLPEQTMDEFQRNRDTKIADALKKFREEKLNNQFPQMCKEYPEYSKMRDAIKDFEQQRSKLLEKLTADISKKRLAADKIIDSLFSHALVHENTDELVEESRIRYDLGRPPGKNKSYGDALNWETLLQCTPDNEDLYFVSDDKDYFSELNPQLFNTYLKEEWNRKKNSDIYFFKRISEFCKEKFPEIEIASEYEKDHLIKSLASSGSFANSRYLLQKITQFESFSTEQLKQFTLACVKNRQVYWIGDDFDIRKMIEGLVEPNREKIDADLLAKYDDVYNQTATEGPDVDDLPF